MQKYCESYLTLVEGIIKIGSAVHGNEIKKFLQPIVAVIETQRNYPNYDKLGPSNFGAFCPRKIIIKI